MSETYNTINSPLDPMNSTNAVVLKMKRNRPYRNEVHHFAQAMEYKLARNDHKGGWSETTIEELFDRLRKEVNELEEAIKDGNQFEITLEAADIANFAMMICDNTTGGSLK